MPLTRAPDQRRSTARRNDRQSRPSSGIGEADVICHQGVQLVGNHQGRCKMNRVQCAQHHRLNRRSAGSNIGVELDDLYTQECVPDGRTAYPCAQDGSRNLDLRDSAHESSGMRLQIRAQRPRLPLRDHEFDERRSVEVDRRYQRSSSRISRRISETGLPSSAGRGFTARRSRVAGAIRPSATRRS
jgi:hypothetical protein